MYIYGLVQDCSNSIANALELLQSCIKLPMSYLSSRTGTLVYYMLPYQFDWEHW